ncbi:kinase-like domain-containing protein [Hyaloraphidium curvatum]|nr:kinase-like domain-containing protein [Hyaloraphidium curvatum]
MDLFELIEHYSARRLLLPPGCVRAIFSQVAAAVAHLHARGVVHRDVKDENVVVAVPSLRAQLADFGSASFYPPPAPGPPGSYPADSHGRALFDTFSGTLDFAPPEVLLGNPYPGPPQDVWSLGCLLFAMLTGANPFRTAREAVQWDGELAGLGRGRGKGLQGAVVEVLQGCLEREAGRRWTVEKVVGSRWVRGLED